MGNTLATVLDPSEPTTPDPKPLYSRDAIKAIVTNFYGHKAKFPLVLKHLIFSYAYSIKSPWTFSLKLREKNSVTNKYLRTWNNDLTVKQKYHNDFKKFITVPLSNKFQDILYYGKNITLEIEFSLYNTENSSVILGLIEDHFNKWDDTIQNSGSICHIFGENFRVQNHDTFSKITSILHKNKAANKKETFIPDPLNKEFPFNDVFRWKKHGNDILKCIIEFNKKTSKVKIKFVNQTTKSWVKIKGVTKYARFCVCLWPGHGVKIVKQVLIDNEMEIIE